MTLTLGWFSTGRGDGSRGLLKLVLDEIQSGDLDADIQFVFSNRELGEAEGSDQFFEMVIGHRIPLITLSSQRFRREHGGGPFANHRLEFDREAMRRLIGNSPDLCVLAGYMLITAAEMCQSYDMINLHPALPSGPVGTWQNVIWKLIETNATETGVMIHVATETVDTGPTVSYVRFPIRGASFDPLWQAIADISVEDLKVKEGEDLPLFRQIRQAGMKREHPLLLETLKALSSGSIRVENGNVLNKEGPLKGGLDLSAKIDLSIS